MMYSGDEEFGDEITSGIFPDDMREEEPWCSTCDRPKNDCACVENGGTY